MSNSLRCHGLKSAKLLCLWEFSKKEYWNGLPFPPSGDILDPEIELKSLLLPWQAGSLPLLPLGSPKNRFRCYCSVAKSCPTLRYHGLRHARPPCPSPDVLLWILSEVEVAGASFQVLSLPTSVFYSSKPPSALEKRQLLKD